MKASKFSSIDTFTKGLTMEIDLCNKRGKGPEKLFSKQGVVVQCHDSKGGQRKIRSK